MSHCVCFHFCSPTSEFCELVLGNILDPFVACWLKESFGLPGEGSTLILCTSRPVAVVCLSFFSLPWFFGHFVNTIYFNGMYKQLLGVQEVTWLACC